MSEHTTSIRLDLETLCEICYKEINAIDSELFSCNYCNRNYHGLHLGYWFATGSQACPVCKNIFPNRIIKLLKPITEDEENLNRILDELFPHEVSDRPINEGSFKNLIKRTTVLIIMIIITFISFTGSLLLLDLLNSIYNLSVQLILGVSIIITFSTIAILSRYFNKYFDSS